MFHPEKFPAASVDTAAWVMIILSGSKLLYLLTVGARGILAAMGHIKFTAALSTTEALVNLALSLLFVLVFGWGLVGVAAGTLAARVLVTTYAMPWYACRKAGMSWKRYLLETFGRGTLAMVLFGGVCIGVRQLGPCTSWSMFAGQVAGEDVVVRHLREDPEKMKKGFEIITESMLIFVQACIEAGVDGFYASTQGGESPRLGGSSIFTDYVKPFDLAVMNEIDARCPFNILHVCDYRAGYDDIAPFVDYPGDVVSFGLELAGKPVSPKRASELFGGRPYLGGLDRLDVIAKGTEDEVRAAVLDVLADAPDRFILGADCTVPSDTPWDNLKVAIQTAHEYR